MTTMTEGAHYKGAGEEHHKRVTRMGLNWYQANITKYAERAYKKGQTEDDIKKIIVYAQLWLEAEETHRLERTPSAPKWVDGEPTPGYVDQDR